MDGPLPKDAITYTYEALGRLLTRAINGAAVTYTYDAVGRVTQEDERAGDVHLHV